MRTSAHAHEHLSVAEYVRLSAIDSSVARRLENPYERDSITHNYMQQSPRVINFDDVCEMFEEYRADRTRNHRALSRSNAVVWQAFHHYLEDQNIKDVVFFAGPPGAGKSTVRLHLKSLHPHLGRAFENGSSVIIDGTMGTKGESERFIQSALRGSKKIHYIYIHRVIHRALPGILHRAQTTGRCVRSVEYAEAVVGSLLNTQKSLRDHAQTISFGFIENNGDIAEMKYLDGHEALTGKIEECLRSYSVANDTEKVAKQKVLFTAEHLLGKLYTDLDLEPHLIKETSGDETYRVHSLKQKIHNYLNLVSLEQLQTEGQDAISDLRPITNMLETLLHT